jgi:hypothetical protein
VVDEPGRLGWIPLFAIVALGTFLRTRGDLLRPLWLDEAWRAYNIALAPAPWRLDEVPEPVPNILLTSEWLLGKVGLLLFDAPEVALRVWPLFFGSILPLAAFALGRRVSGSRTGLLSALLVAVSPALVEHSREFKPYELDCLLTATAWASTWWMIEAPASRLRAWALAMLVFSASSLVAAFVVPAVVACAWLELRPEHRRAVVLTAVAAGAAFLVTFVTVLEPQATSHVRDLWTDHYLSDVGSLSRLARLGAQSVRAFSPLPLWPTLLACLVVTPTLAILRRDGRLLWLYASVPLQAAASAVGLYPLFGRPSSYLFLLMLVTLAHSIAALAGDGRSRARIAAVVVALVALSSPPFRSVPLWQRLAETRDHPPSYGDAVLARLADDLAPDDLVLTDIAGFFHLQVYGPPPLRLRFGDPPTDPRMRLQVIPESWHPRFRHEICTRTAAAHARRVWLVSLWTTPGLAEHAAATPPLRLLLEDRHETLVLLDRDVAAYCAGIVAGELLDSSSSRPSIGAP